MIGARTYPCAEQMMPFGFPTETFPGNQLRVNVNALVVVVPEPATGALVAAGVIGLALRRRGGPSRIRTWARPVMSRLL